MTKTKKEFVTIVTIFLLMGLLFVLSNPSTLPLPLTILPHIMLFILIYLGANMIFKSTMFKNNHSMVRWLSLSVAAFPVLIIVLQSMGQLTARDVLIALSLIGLLIFYFRKTNL